MNSIDLPPPTLRLPRRGERELEEAWQKIYRARELLDVELMNLREQQEALQTRRTELDQRAAVLTAPAAA